MIATLVYCASATSWLTSHFIQVVQSLFPQELASCVATPVQPSFAPLRYIGIIASIVVLCLALGAIASTKISPGASDSPPDPTSVDHISIPSPTRPPIPSIPEPVEDIPAPLEDQQSIVPSPIRHSTFYNSTPADYAPVVRGDQSSIPAPSPPRPLTLSTPNPAEDVPAPSEDPQSITPLPTGHPTSSNPTPVDHVLVLPKEHRGLRAQSGAIDRSPPSWLTPGLLVILISMISYLVIAVPVMVQRELIVRQRPLEVSIQGALLEYRRSSEDLRLSLESAEDRALAAENNVQLLLAKHELLADHLELLQENYRLLKENHRAQEEDRRSREAEFRDWWDEVRRSQETEFQSWREKVQRPWHEENLRSSSKDEGLPENTRRPAEGVSLEDVKRLLAQDAQRRQMEDAVKSTVQEARRAADQESQRRYTDQRVRSVSEALVKAEKQRRRAAAVHVCATKRWWSRFVIRFRPLLVAVALECIIKLLIPHLLPLIKMIGFRINDRLWALSRPARVTLVVWITYFPLANFVCHQYYMYFPYVEEACLFYGLIPLGYSYLRPILDLNPLATIIKTYLVAMAWKDIIVVLGLFALCRGYHYLTWKPSALDRLTALATEINRIREAISNGQDVNARPNVAPPSYFEALDAGAVDEWSAALVAGL